MSRTPWIPVAGVIAFVLLALGCGEKQAAAPATESAEPAASEVAPALSRTPSPSGARVFFITPADGESVTSPVTVEFGIEAMSVVTAGDDTPESGHHHLLIDTGLPELGLPIPADENHIHFGDGSTSTELELSPGEHTLQLLLGDHLHIPHDPPVASGTITITVK